MASPRTTETCLLSPVEAKIADCTREYPDSFGARLALLEEVACSYSGLPIGEYRKVCNSQTAYIFNNADVYGIKLAIDGCGIAPSLALASLSREPLAATIAKSNGSFYTDFRLATYLAGLADNNPKQNVIDPSCGTGILLAAYVERMKSLGHKVSDIIEHHIFGVDLSTQAARGAVIALSVFADSLTAVSGLANHFIVANSLLQNCSLECVFDVHSFDLVIGNPPWERIRLTRAEYLNSTGLETVYGTAIDSMPEEYELSRAKVKEYASAISKKYDLSGEPDLYRAFLCLGLALSRNQAKLLMILPAGVVRSKSLCGLRNELAHSSGYIHVSMFDNKAKFFSIDSRFKFIVLHRNGGAGTDKVSVSYCEATEEKVIEKTHVSLSAEDFAGSPRSSLGMPEVRTEQERRVLKKIQLSGICMSNESSPFHLSPEREVDMTLDRKNFIAPNTSSSCLPVIEGRMVSQYRCGAKAYRSGSGRSAVWEACSFGVPEIIPQFAIPREAISSHLLERSSKTRVGFCDITGQTNERAMHAALIPSGYVCGNKVPTLAFDEDRAFVWMAIVNSFVFDWILRRYITTTVNFFILENIPLPNISMTSEIAKKLQSLSRQVVSLYEKADAWSVENIWEIAETRAKIDAIVAGLYGLSTKDMETIFLDFPLVDKAYRGLVRDTALSPTFECIRCAMNLSNYPDGKLKKMKAAEMAPYVSSEYMRTFGK